MHDRETKIEQLTLTLHGGVEADGRTDWVPKLSRVIDMMYTKASLFTKLYLTDLVLAPHIL